jgi:predicted site-specific integrase-resolvase
MRESTSVAAALTGVAARTIRRWAVDGRLTYSVEAGRMLVCPMQVSELREMRSNGRMRRMPRLTTGR